MLKLFFLSAIAWSALLYGSPIDPDKADKIRISFTDVCLDNRGIFFNLNGEWVQAAMLGQDSHGLYAIRDSHAETDVGIAWSCSECGRWNWGGDNICRHCGEQR